MFIKTVSTTSGINPIKFDETGGVFYWILNTGSSTIYASTKSAFTAGDDGVVSLGPKESRRLETNNDTIYILGEGQVEIHNQRDGICSFKQAPTSSGGGETIDAYTKNESDAKYAAKSDVPDAYTKTESDDKYAQKIDVVPYKMGMDFGTCTTAAETVVKSVTTLHKVAPALGAVFAVKFTYGVPASAILNVNNLTGYVQYKGSGVKAGIIGAGDVVTFMYHSIGGNNSFEILSIENGGNADTVDGKHASDFVLASTLQQVNASRIGIPDNVNVGEWLAENAKIGTLYFCTGYEVGQTNLPGGLRGWMWFSFDGNGYYARVMVSDTATKDFILNKVNNVGKWKEISYAPIKSTTFSGTTNEYGNVVFTAVGSKIPLFAECSPYCGIPLRFNDNYWIHCINPITTSNSIVANTAVTGTVYYVEI